ncbi:MAG: alpha-rhamnosidase, partial [Rikenellaceae bacterium]|nr:alpha-rhamnosidase [Rikenellaceae bacterium]
METTSAARKKPQANVPTWIWYPGDYEIWLGNEMNNRRTERGAFFPPFWKIDSHYVVVDFSKKFDLKEAETVDIRVEGKYLIKIDGKYLTGFPSRFTIPAGIHTINVKVWNQATPPAIYITGKNVFTDNTWSVTFEDKEWIDESGKVSDTSGTEYVNAGSWHFDSPDRLPSQFHLATERQYPVSCGPKKNGILVDFGKETFGYITIHGLEGNGKFNLFYG